MWKIKWIEFKRTREKIHVNIFNERKKETVTQIRRKMSLFFLIQTSRTPKGSYWFIHVSSSQQLPLFSELAHQFYLILYMIVENNSQTELAQSYFLKNKPGKPKTSCSSRCKLSPRCAQFELRKIKKNRSKKWQR